MALYLPVKAFLERQGYVVRGEVRGCDLVAYRGNEEPVIVELKLRFTLSLLLQGVNRLALSPLVYLAVPRPMARTRGMRPDAKPVRKLCRRLGLGLMVIAGRGAVEVIEDPVPFRAAPVEAPIDASCSANSSAAGADTERRWDEPNSDRHCLSPRRGTASVHSLQLDRCGWANCALCLASPQPRRSCNATSTAGSIASDRGTYGLTVAGEEALNRFAQAIAVLDEPIATEAQVTEAFSRSASCAQQGSS